MKRAKKNQVSKRRLKAELDEAHKNMLIIWREMGEIRKRIKDEVDILDRKETELSSILGNIHYVKINL